MGKKIDVKPLPPTKAETAEKRLEELINKGLVAVYYAKEDSFEIEENKCKYYPDGFEAVIRGHCFQVKGVLHLTYRRTSVYYDLEKENEQNGKT